MASHAKKKQTKDELRESKLKRTREKKTKKGTSALLDAIFSYHGGPRATAALLSSKLSEEIGEQHMINWRIRGRVPFKKVGRIATILGVDFYALNYQDSCMFFGHKEWTSVVKSSGIILPTESIRVILAAAHPVSKSKRITTGKKKKNKVS